MEHWLNVVALHTKSLVKNHMFLNEAWRSLKLIKHQNFHLVNFYNILYHTFRYTSKIHYLQLGSATKTSRAGLKLTCNNISLIVGHKNRQISKLEKSHKNQLYKVDLQKWKFPIKLKIQLYSQLLQKKIMIREEYIE